VAPPSIAKEKADAFGIDQVCERVSEGLTLTKIAQEIGISIGSLLTWIESDTERSARARETRVATARLWDEKAEQCIEGAPDEFELKRAKELAHHYRWRAAKIAPKEYGDRLEVENSGMPMVIIKDFTGRKNEPADD
jgi:transposase